MTDDEHASHYVSKFIKVKPYGEWIISTVFDSSMTYGSQLYTCIIDGRPAAALCNFNGYANSGGLYKIAEGVSGSNWTEAAIIPEIEGYDRIHSMCEVQGSPAVLYSSEFPPYRTDTFFSRATDAEGTDWNEIVEIVHDFSITSSLHVVNEKPAIVGAFHGVSPGGGIPRKYDIYTLRLRSTHTAILGEN